MEASEIARRKDKTNRAMMESGHALKLVYRGGAHTRWVCVHCSRRFQIDEFHPPEAPGYWDDNHWGVCEKQVAE
jgi:hypothetical protein